MGYWEALSEALRKMSRLYLGLDTSNYTTSISIVDQDGKIVQDLRRLLKVKEGERGLRQQEALFQHVKNLPELFEELSCDTKDIRAVGVSTRPRSEDGSYMPVFLAGEGFGRAVSAMLKVPLFRLSHQEGHGACAIMDDPGIEKALMLHISGGTTELAELIDSNEGLYTRILGGTLDISLGQLVDRVGVKLGMGFPCGMKMDKLSMMGSGLSLSLKIVLNDGWINLSGFENKFSKEIDKGSKPEDICNTLFLTSAKVCEALIRYGLSLEAYERVIVAGGVAENSIIRERLDEIFPQGLLSFTKSGLSSDNAVGIAWLTRRLHEGRE